MVVTAWDVHKNNIAVKHHKLLFDTSVVTWFKLIIFFFFIWILLQCLLFTALPFLEDLRQFAFAPLDANKKWEPSGKCLLL